MFDNFICILANVEEYYLLPAFCFIEVFYQLYVKRVMAAWSGG